MLSVNTDHTNTLTHTHSCTGRLGDNKADYFGMLDGKRTFFMILFFAAATFNLKTT